jgi:hypothetical protein
MKCLVDGQLAAEELLGFRELPREEKADYQTAGGMVMKGAWVAEIAKALLIRGANMNTVC